MDSPMSIGQSLFSYELRKPHDPWLSLKQTVATNGTNFIVVPHCCKNVNRGRCCLYQ
jgi:hypothetical protein